MANFPGGTGVNPGVYTDVVTQSRGVSIPGGVRIAAVIGEGSTDETLVSQASGGGQDGLNSSYSGTTGRDGRHFQSSNFPLISNRTTLFKNGIPLVGHEETFTNSMPALSNKYDYRIDITTGRIELQSAHLVDQGGAYYVPLSTNVGQGTFSSLTLVDVNAPPETWSVRCSSVQRDILGNPVAKTAKFMAYGSVSGAKLDANGNPVIWKADGYVVSNGILSFAIVESTNPSQYFREGDAFTVKVASGVLVRNDSLVINSIPSNNLNDPVLLDGLGAVVARHGLPSLDNNLSLGAQLAFANAAPALMTVQAAPSMPRRTSYVLSESVNALSDNQDDFIFPLPVGVTVDFNSNIHFFVTNNSTNVETQILPNKLDYYLLDTAGYPTTNDFVFDNVSAPAGSAYSYTVMQYPETLASGFDGYIARTSENTGVFISATTFDSSYVGKTLSIEDATNKANIGYYLIDGVVDGKLIVSTSNGPSAITHNAYHFTAQPYFSPFIAGTSVAFEVVNKITGAVLDGYSGTDGVLTEPATLTAADGYLNSASVDFNTVPSIASLYRLRINLTGSLPYTPDVLDERSDNNGLYDIVSVSANEVVIKKAIVEESNMRYELLNLDEQSSYIVLNHNVVPNGYRLRVNLVDERDASFYDAGWLNALESLEAVECDIVVPLPKQTISVIFQNALAHCKLMSNIRNKKERILFMGAINGLTPDNLTGASPAAVEDIGILEGIQGETVTDVLAGNVEDLANYSVSDAFGNTYRCVYFYPDQIVVQAGADNVLVDGFYLAAAAAGYESADIRLENPLTNKVLSGFTILRNKLFSPLVLEQLSAAGVTTLQPVSGGGRIVWGRTTTQSGYPEEEEISIIFIRDRIAKSLRDGFAGYIGTPETPDTPAILNTRGIILLNSFVSQGLITQYRDFSVKRDDVDPRQWNITVRVQPSYPINFIYIKVNVGQV